MGEVIEKSGIYKNLKGKRWVLVSHGDYGRIRREENGNEEGYFPLMRADIVRYGPSEVILGHIHNPDEMDEHVRYPGSPYPLNINEVGQRLLLYVDTETGSVTKSFLEDPPVFHKKEIFVIPDSKERDQIRNQLEIFFEDVSREYQGSDFCRKLKLRLLLSGYTTAREGIKETIQGVYEERKIPLDSVELQDSLKISEDENLAKITRKVKEQIDGMEVPAEYGNTMKDQILKTAFGFIYS